MPSYSVRCHFEWLNKVTRLSHLYEERILLWQADSIDEAIVKAEKEALEYASNNSFIYLELSQAYWLFTSLDNDGIEVYSLLRESDLASKKYLDSFHDTGNERQSQS